MRWLIVGLLFCDFPVLGKSQPSSIDREAELGSRHATEIDRTGRQDSAEQQLTGTISGTVVDRTGGTVAGAHVKLSRQSQSPSQDVMSDADGRFSFASVPAGPFQLTTSADGFATQNFSGELHPGENYSVPAIALAVATA